ncbi:MAG: hypothetical protein ACKV2T_16380, partial [Kofleriaceae bacterium]
MTLSACAADRSRTAPPPRDLDTFGEQPHATTPAPAPATTSTTAPTPAPSPPSPTPTPTPSPTPTLPPNPATLTALGWPADTMSYVVKISAHVFEAPDMKLEPLGKVLA